MEYSSPSLLSFPCGRVLSLVKAVPMRPPLSPPQPSPFTRRHLNRVTSLDHRGGPRVHPSALSTMSTREHRRRNGFDYAIPADTQARGPSVSCSEWLAQPNRARAP